MSRGYQPLVAYSALSDVPIEEARFQPGVADENLLEAGRFGGSFIRPAPGFQSMIYLHDGERHRVIAFWQNEVSIEQFHAGRRKELIEQERRELPESPWVHQVESFRRGVARRQLLGPRMGMQQMDLATVSGFAPALIYEVSGATDMAAILELWADLVPRAGAPKIQEYAGFMFFAACDYGAGDFSIYLGFRDRPGCDGFKVSEFAVAYHRAATEILASQDATLTIHEGNTLAWTVRQID